MQNKNRVIFADYVTDGRELKHNSFECAAWDETVLLDAGEHPISGELTVDGQVKDSVTFTVPGTIDSDCFQSLWCGTPIGDRYDCTKNKGKPARWRSGTYCHTIARDILEGRGSNVRLRQGFEARAIDFVYDGRPCRTYGIFRVDGDE